MGNTNFEDDGGYFAEQVGLNTVGNNWFNVEKFGAVPIDPDDPDAAADSSAAIQAAIIAALASDNKAPILYFPGMYKVSRDPSQMINSVQHYLMLYIPLTSYDPDGVDYKTITFMGQPGSFERQAIGGAFKTPLNGSGLYCARIESSDRNAAVLGSEIPNDETAIWGPHNYTTVNFEGTFSVVIKTVNSGTDVINYMSGIDLNHITQVTIDKVRVMTTSDLADSVEPGANTFGLRLPKANNHLILHVGLLYLSGFGFGLISGEHATIQTLGCLGNKVALYVRSFYPTTISQFHCEDNAYNISGDTDSYCFIGAYQAENYVGAKWYENVVDFNAAGTAADMHLVIGIVNCHAPSTGKIPLTVSSEQIDVKIISDEDGISHIPTNIWTTATRPTPLGRGLIGYNSDTGTLELYYQGVWIDPTEPPVALWFADDFNGTNGTAITAHTPDTGNPMVILSGTWEIQSNRLKEVSGAGLNALCITQNLPDEDCLITFDYDPGATGGGDRYSGIAFRVVDANNYNYLQFNDVGGTKLLRIISVVAGSANVEASESFSFTDSTLHAGTIELVGNNVTVTVNSSGKFGGAVSVTENATGKKTGMVRGLSTETPSMNALSAEA